jgi:hypothetical protein
MLCGAARQVVTRGLQRLRLNYKIRKDYSLNCRTCRSSGTVEGSVQGFGINSLYHGFSQEAGIIIWGHDVSKRNKKCPDHVAGSNSEFELSFTASHI